MPVHAVVALGAPPLAAPQLSGAAAAQVEPVVAAARGALADALDATRAACSAPADPGPAAPPVVVLCAADAPLCDARPPAAASSAATDEADTDDAATEDPGRGDPVADSPGRGGTRGGGPAGGGTAGGGTADGGTADGGSADGGTADGGRPRCLTVLTATTGPVPEGVLAPYRGAAGGAAGEGVPPPLPLGAALTAAWLPAPPAGPATVTVAVLRLPASPGAADLERAAGELRAVLAAAAEGGRGPLVLAVVGDGSVRTGAGAPGYRDDASDPYTTAVAAAWASGDPAQLTALDLGLGGRLLAAGAPAWAVTGRALTVGAVTAGPPPASAPGAAASGPAGSGPAGRGPAGSGEGGPGPGASGGFQAELRLDAAPAGVATVVALWTRSAGPRHVSPG